MKKMVSFISAFLMCAVMVLPVVSSAGGAEDTGNTSTATPDDKEIISEINEKIITNSTVECTNNIKSSYTVTIPDGKADLSKPVEFRVSATNVVIGTNQTLDISVKSENNWRLLNIETKEREENEREYITYEFVPKSITKTIYNQDGNETDETESIENPVALTNENNNVLTIKNSEACDTKITKVLTAKITSNAKVAGVYKDTLTFTVEVNGELATDVENPTKPEVEDTTDNQNQ